MSQNQDTANEPVQPVQDDEFMDTGMLHEPKKKKGEDEDAEVDAS